MTTRALLVVDVQKIYDSGPLQITYPPLTTSLANIGRAMELSRTAGIPVIVVQHIPSPLPNAAARFTVWDLHPDIARRDRDLLLVKAQPSCFAGTELDSWLRHRSIDTITLVGYMTHNCVDSTARDATHRGYAVEVLNDATGTLPYANAAGSVDAATLHTATLVALHARFAAVTSTGEWAAAVASGASVPQGDVMRSAEAGAAAHGSGGTGPARP